MLYDSKNNITIRSSMDYQRLNTYEHLRESYGIREFSNDEFKNEISEIASTLYKSRNYTAGTLINKHDKTKKSGKLFQFNIKSVDWIKKLNVIVCHNYNSDEKYVDISVIANSKAYSFAYDDYGCPVSNYQQLNLYDISFELYDENKNIEYFEVDDKSMKTATILFCFNKMSYDKFEYDCALHHELSHISDLIYNKVHKLNSEIIETDYISGIISRQDFINRESQDIIYDIKYNEEILDILIDLICENLYILNISEMKARLNNFYGIFKEMNIVTLYNKINKYTDLNKKSIPEILCSISDVFNDYYKLYIALGLFNDYLDKDLKNKFIQYINLFINRERDNKDIKYIFGKKFTSTTELLVYLRERIYDNFLHKSLSLFYNELSMKFE